MEQGLDVPATKLKSTYDSVIPWPTILYLLGYMIYNFTLEYRSWDGDTLNSTATQKLEEICAVKEQLFIFLLVCGGLSICWTFGIFIYDYFKLFNQAMESNVLWFCALMFLALLNCANSILGILLISLMIPSSFLMCFSILTHYQCTIALAVLVGIVMISCIVRCIEGPIMNFKVVYTSLSELRQDDLQEEDVELPEAGNKSTADL